MDIIIYGSLHGAAKRYADGLAKMTGICALDYKKSKSLDPYKRVIYLGSIYAGGVTGLKKTIARLVPGQEFFLVTVGMVDPGDNAFFDAFREALKKQIPSPFFDEKKVFHLHGAIDYGQFTSWTGKSQLTGMTQTPTVLDDCRGFASEFSQKLTSLRNLNL